jgi:hypothetical protein
MASTPPCPACATCPDVVLDGDTIRVGEGSRRITLEKAQCNVLVDVIRSGEVGKIQRRR